jgi:DNA-binding CsgD family transcriptional regulator
VREIAHKMRQPFILHVAEHYESSLALFDGRLAEAERAAERSHELGRVLTGRDASGIYGIQMFGIRREQGRLAELSPVIRILAADSRDGGAWRPGLAAMLAELGMIDALRDELTRVRKDGLASLREGLWIASLTYLADAACAAGDEKIAELVYPELEPLTGANVMIGHGVACYGAADRYLGMLAATIGDIALARRHFEAALIMNRQMGAATWLAHTAYQYGRALLRGDDAGEGASLLDEAVELAERLCLPALLARSRSLGTEHPLATPDGLSSRELEILRLVARGLSNREIGSALFISEHTAANHIRSILRKTGSANRTEATAYAFQRGLAQS